MSGLEIRNALKRFDQDAKNRAVQLVEDRILTENLSIQQACKIVSLKLGIFWNTASQWTPEVRCNDRVVEGKGSSPRIMRKPKCLGLRPDWVVREFTMSALNKLLVADITPVRNKKGFVYPRLSPKFTPDGPLGGH